MASSKLPTAILPLLFCCSLLLLFIQAAAASPECDSGHGCSKPVMAASQQFLLNRKVGYAKLAKEEVVSGLPAKNKYYNGGHGPTGYGETVEDWELRKVPAGPDPLHHNGASPKKPRITP